MAKPKAKVVVVPFYDGPDDAAEVFKRIIMRQIEEALKEKTENNMHTEKKFLTKKQHNSLHTFLKST